MNQPMRIAIAAGIVWYALGMPGVGGKAPLVPSNYSGRLSSLHVAAGGMDPADRATMAGALAAAGNALAADTRGLVGTTEAAQRFYVAVLEFGYAGMGSPKQKYPAVASALSAEFERVVGKDVAAMDAAKRAELAETFKEAAAAVR